MARVELQWDLAEIAERFGFPSTAAAGMAVRRAMQRLSARLDPARLRNTEGDPTRSSETRHDSTAL
jgi:hypothetical protein